MHRIWDKENTMGLWVVTVIVNFGSDASKCADKLWHFLCASAVVFLLKSRADDRDVIL